MKSTNRRLSFSIAISRLTSLCLCLAAAVSADAATLTWSTAVDHTSSGASPHRSLRSLALSDQSESVYIGYINPSGSRRIFRHDTSTPYAELNTHLSGGDQPKGLATDDRGNVFAANRGSTTTSSRIQSFSSALVPNANQTPATTPVIGGIATQRSGSTYYAYTVYESSNGLIQRYDVTDPNNMFLDTTFGTNGSYSIPGAGDLRGVEVGPDGSLFIAARGDNRVYKVAGDLSSFSFEQMTLPQDVAVFGDKLYVTSYNGVNSLIRVFNQSNLSFVEDITIATLDGNPYTRGTSEGWSGIDIGADGRIWLLDQVYGGSGSTLQDRLLVSTSLLPQGPIVPEPGTFVSAVFVAALVGLSRKRRVTRAPAGS